MGTKLEQFYTIDNGTVYSNNQPIAIYCPKGKLYSILLRSLNINWEDYISSKLLPDEAIYVEHSNTLYIIEKKYQQVSGSVDEKLQTCGFKKWQYSRLVSSQKIKVEYIYLLNDWFEQHKYRDTLDYIIREDCHYYFNELPLEHLCL